MFKHQKLQFAATTCCLTDQQFNVCDLLDSGQNDCEIPKIHNVQASDFTATNVHEHTKICFQRLQSIKIGISKKYDEIPKPA